MDALEKKRSSHVVVPALNWLVATLYEAGAFGYATEAAEKVGYKKELEAAIRGLREMHKRGIVVLPGGYVDPSTHFQCFYGYDTDMIIPATTASLGRLTAHTPETSNTSQNSSASRLTKPSSQRHTA
jgi:hypothetical protein